MPSYLYFCESCEREFEEFHSINDKIDECPFCKKENKIVEPKRLISGGTGFILKGGGWFREGY